MSSSRKPSGGPGALLIHPRSWQCMWVSITLLGEVERVTFENEETGFRVLRLGRVQGHSQKRVTVVGVLPAVGPGTRVRVSGRIETDARHGERLRADSLVVLAPETVLGVEKYLASGVVPGIGPGFAKRIVKYFGMETLPMLDAASHRLHEVPGLGKARIEKIREGWLEHRALSNILIALQSSGASPGLASRILKHFGERAVTIVQSAPYRLAIEISGVGFKTADTLARAQGLPLDHPERMQAGLLAELEGQADSGHCYLERAELLRRAAEMLVVSEAAVEVGLDGLWAAQRIVIEDDRVFLSRLHRAETRVARRVLELMIAPVRPLPGLAASLQQFERAFGTELAERQREAVHLAAEGKFAIVTGGPGVGKTTIVKAILAVLAGEKLRVALAAPTGRAAKRLTESTGHPAQTIHRLLQVNPRTGSFERNEENPLETDLLIIDEASMIDVRLAESLLLAVPDAARVVLVGDVDQLPSVGPGALLADLIESGVVPVARLDVIFRQVGESGIIQGSHRILRGEPPVGAKDAEGDFFVIGARDPERARDLVVELVSSRIPKRFGFDPRREIQVLTPMHRGEAGTVMLNACLQASLNPSGISVPLGELQLRQGDKVLQTKNDYDKGVFNGDVGEIVAVDPEVGSVVAQFEDEQGSRLVKYERSELLDLRLAYATSIHKSQGSEYPAVVIVFLTSHFVMLSRNLLYTAVTRAKKLCVLVADPRAVRVALGEVRRERRQTWLSARLRDPAEARVLPVVP